MANYGLSRILLVAVSLHSAVHALVPNAAPQALELAAGIPSCALDCFAEGIQSTGCGKTDYGCQCGQLSVLETTTQPCLVSTTCTAQKTTKLMATITEICGLFITPNATTPMISSMTGPANMGIGSWNSSAMSTVMASGTATSFLMPIGSATPSSTSIPPALVSNGASKPWASTGISASVIATALVALAIAAL